ncbi:sigma-54 dependent transcriptional regulator [Inquilinus limosus]|uniref:sigma-54-dependent transcriptional regulator n=1 Tax=Inquilinus limosus TaxID=171674 RepID=UPI003F157EFA
MTEDPHRILVVEDDPTVAGSIEQWLGLCGFAVETARSAAEALRRIDGFGPDAVLTDVRMPGGSGLELQRRLAAERPGLPVVLLTGHGDVPMAVAALQAGAFDFMTKPYEPDHLAAVLRNAAAQHRLRRRVGELEGRLDDALAATLVGDAPAMRRLRRLVAELAALPVDVVVRGETGTGKEVAARALHEFGPRRDRPFVAINCAAIPAEMIEGELFGHEAGAFTGARGARIGKFEHADGGTVLLDEVESMPLPAQAKLLRVLQERVVERLGSNRQIPVDIRVVAAAKADLRERAAAGAFREDLFFRLAGVEIEIPPLRDRGDDILLLFERFAGAAADRLGLERRHPSPAEVAALLGHGWPGNVRELKAAAERFAMGLSGAGAGDILNPAAQAGGGLAERVAAYERALILAALRETGGSVAAALEILDLPRRTLNEKMARLGIDRSRLDPPD